MHISRVFLRAKQIVSMAVPLWAALKQCEHFSLQGCVVSAILLVHKLSVREICVQYRPLMLSLCMDTKPYVCIRGSLKEPFERALEVETT